MKIVKALLLLLATALVLTVGVFSVLWLANAPQQFSDDSESYARLHQSNFTVGTTEIKYVDSARATPALGEFKGADSRTLEGTVWFPEGESTGHPFLVFSHGFGSYHKGSRHIAEHLARNGYIVAAVDYPLSHTRSPAGTPQLLDIANQPGDVSAVIDYMLGQ
ncbi:MAG: hypothetical protein AAF197_03540, partial [Pseudomonadota bacterium]